jgi:tRNA-splicing ligase RtcB
LDLGREYLTAMDLAGLYAYAGREWVVHTIVPDFMQAGITDTVHNHHNYAWKKQVGNAEHYVVRKGATFRLATALLLGFVGESTALLG